MAIDWQPLHEIIEANRRFILSSHVRPDADAIGSEMALARMLEERGKSVRIANPSHMPSHLAFLDPDGRAQKIGEGIAEDDIIDTDVHIILDTSAWKQLQDVGKAFKKSQAVKVVVDHHASADDLGAVEFKDTRAEATGTLVFHLGESLDATITPEIARALFSAIATDTGWFRFPSTNADTLRIAALLIDSGAEPHILYERLYEQYSLSRLKLTGRVLSRVHLECGGKLAYTIVEWNDFVETGAKPAETENLVNECLKIAGARGAFIAVEQQNGTVKFSFRSRGDLNVARVAEKLGGGGHKQAAGAVLPGPLPEAQARVLAEIKTAVNE